MSEENALAGCPPDAPNWPAQKDNNLKAEAH
jgi:hypothetical protein